VSLRRSVQHHFRPLRLLVAVGLMSFVTLTGTASASVNTLGQNVFGFSMGAELQYEEPALLERDLDAIKAAGSRWVRIDIYWAEVQDEGPSSYDWTETDRIVRSVTSRGMKVLGAVAYTPSWARPSGATDKYGPAPDHYAAFAQQTAAHLSKMGVHAYEVWNEPNIGFWAPSPDPAAYTEVLKAAYSAIKAGDPHSTVLTGGTAPASTKNGNYSPIDFLKKIYAYGGGDSFDAVGHHPYCWPAYPGDAESWSAWHQMYGTTTSLRSVMIANGDAGKKIWGTEFGAPTNGPPGDRVTEQEQAQMITKAYSLWKTYDWAGPLFTYQGRDIGTDTSDRLNFFGLLRHDFSKKPAYTAYQNMATGATGPNAIPGTNLIVEGNGHGADGGSATGSVTLKPETPTAPEASTTPESPTTPESSALTGSVELRLYKRTRHGWRPRSKERPARLKPGGRFRKRLRAFRKGKLAPGKYRIRARYPGSHAARASEAKSRKFKLRT
jgi:hypothetical protein